MTRNAIIFSILLIIVIPAAMWAYTAKKQSGKSFIWAILISVIGTAVGLCILDEYNVFSEYQNTRNLIIVAIALFVIFFGVWKLFDGDNDMEGIFIIISAILFVGFIVFVPYTYMTEEEAVYNKKIEVTMCVQTEKIEILSLNSGSGVEGRSYVSGNWRAVVGSGYIDNEPIYFYYHRNENGAIIRSHVPSSEETTEIYDTLGDGEQAFLQIVNTVEVKTDNNYSPAKVTETIVDTKYYFYVPKDCMPINFEMNLN